MANARLADLVERAYVIFAGDPPPDVGVCIDCCMAPDDAARLLRLPVREIPQSLLAQWLDAATSQDFPTATWLHFVPRILDSLANGHDPTLVGLEVALVRGRGVPMNLAQRQVVNAFHIELLAHTAEHRPDELDAILCMLARGGRAPSELGEALLALPDDVLVGAMHHQFCSVPYSVVCTAFWDEPERSRMHAFYESRALYDRMEALGLQDGPLGDLAAEVADAMFVSDDGCMSEADSDEAR